ncbi:MAG TPA: arylsulfatase [Xanthomonadales bacterium]|nr:arylsulfatase [Xanthomonadales bacterium]
MNFKSLVYVLVITQLGSIPGAYAQTAPDNASVLDRTVLPIQEPTYPVITELDARKATPPPRFEVKAPEGAPNVVIVLIDDMGFGQPSAFGGGIAMPTLERLAAGGLSYNQFHTTALCSPTRVALKYGRNHHNANAGSVTEIATAFPGNQARIPNSVAPLAEMLRLNGYSTAAYGKWHETAPWEVSVSGPFDRWPTRQGFDEFYGFIGGETNQWSPLIYHGTVKVELEHGGDYHFTTDMTNQAIAWMRAQQSLTPDKPFYIYYAPGATHAPHHVPKDWIAKYKGKFDEGWDAYREQTLARQIKLGVVPAGTKLAPKPKDIKDWDVLSPQEKTLFARQMEVYAAFGEQTDHEIGRLAQAITDMGEMDNTLFIYIAGDNGASAEGKMTGLFNETSMFNGVPEPIELQLQQIDEWGGPSTYPHYAAGWAIAGNTPFTWAKQVASSYGGTRNGMVIHWPKGIKAKAGMRSQWHHVVDIAPTILEAAGLPFPATVNGSKQKPFDGVSLAYTFDDAEAANRHLTQYFEIMGNRAIYHDGWLAGTVHRAPWETTPRATFEADTWELYDTHTDFSLVNDLAAGEPDKLKEMQALFLSEAVKNSVLPLDDRSMERFNAAIAGRPDLMAGRTSLTVYDGMTGLMENAFINVKNTSHSVTAEIEVPQGGAEGVVIAQAGRFAGWSLYFKDGKPAYAHNFVGLQTFTVAATEAVVQGQATVRMDFAYDGGGLAKGGTVTLTVNGLKVAEGRLDHTVPMVFSGDEGTDVGVDNETPVTDAYAESDNRFNGTIHEVRIELK